MTMFKTQCIVWPKLCEIQVPIPLNMSLDAGCSSPDMRCCVLRLTQGIQAWSFLLPPPPSIPFSLLLLCFPSSLSLSFLPFSFIYFCSLLKGGCGYSEKGVFSY
ncbi:mCG147738 [Mus musculus]|nr:mCG147738 [Mus musculus]